MEPQPQGLKMLLVAAALVSLLTAGCGFRWREFVYGTPAAMPLGTLSDPVWQNQEANAERSDFVLREHEFQLDSEFLNTAGEDHLKQIAARLAAGQGGPVIVERSKHASRPHTAHKYPVHPNPDLDMLRREIVVRSLVVMGIPWADELVVVAPDLAPQYRAEEVEAMYHSRGYQRQGAGWGGAGAGGAFGRGF